MTTRRFLIAGLLCSAIGITGYEAQRATFGTRPVSVSVTWAPTVGEAVRQWLERRYSLSRGRQTDGRTWGYALLDSSRANIRALVSDPSAAGTLHIDRTAFRVSSSASRLPYATTYPWLPVRLRGLSILCVVLGLVGFGLGLIERVAPGTTGTWIASGHRKDAVFALILLSAFLIRLYSAATTGYVDDEDKGAIPRSQTISFAWNDVRLPIRAGNHPALPAYFVKVSGNVFGTTPIGYRLVHVVTGTGIIVMIFSLARQWYGAVAARWTAALLSFNEYFVGVSSRATAHVPYLLFTGTAIYAFGRFVATQRAIYLYAAGGALGVAFYAKEHAALLLPVFALVLLHPKYWRWFRSPHVYVACGLFVLVIAPDLFWNLTAGEDIPQATYGDHLARIGGIGFSPYPLMFYARDLIRWLHLLVTGRPLGDATAEYLSMNLAMGTLLVGATLVTTFRRPRPDTSRFLLLLFWGVFGFFSMIRPHVPPKHLDPVSWIWVDVTMFPTVMLAGTLLAGARGRYRTVAGALACGAMVYAVAGIIG